VDLLTRGAARALRACVVAGACTAVSVSGHQWGGGGAPGPGGSAAVAGVAFALALAGSGRRWTFGRLLVVLGAAQAGCHALFASAAGGPASAPVSGVPSVLMVAGHALAAVLLAGFLGYGETVLWRVVELSAALAARVRRRLGPPLAAPGSPRRVALPAPPARGGGISTVLVTGSPRRGPPRWPAPA
jgi:hypothetical protein